MLRGPFWLRSELHFPPHEAATEDGLLALGGDLTPRRLLHAYSVGIFPWYSAGSPILWWSPDPRFVLRPDGLHVGRTLRQTIRRRPFTLTLDTAFEAVIRRCGELPRPGQRGTWITEDMILAYCQLHRLGFAHSVEAWREGQLVGGLYGVSLGASYFGESMFYLDPDASKVAFVLFARQLDAWGFRLIDCQVETDHLRRFGASDMPRAEFLDLLTSTLEAPTRRGPWAFDADPYDL